MDHIHTINQLKEKYQEFNIPLCVAFVDYEKAFDSVETYAVLKALQDQGINNAYIKILKDIYSDCYSTVRMHKASNKIMIRKEVRQWDTGSPKQIQVNGTKMEQSLTGHHSLWGKTKQGTSKKKMPRRAATVLGTDKLAPTGAERMHLETSCWGLHPAVDWQRLIK